MMLFGPKCDEMSQLVFGKYASGVPFVRELAHMA